METSEHPDVEELTDYFGKGPMVGFDGSWDVLLANEIGTKKHEGIGGTWNITLRTSLAWRAAFARRLGW